MSDKKTGLSLIQGVREKQIKNGYTADNDLQYQNDELAQVASTIITPGLTKKQMLSEMPAYWDFNLLLKLVNKSYIGRLADAGALIAAELDRVLLLQDKPDAKSSKCDHLGCKKKAAREIEFTSSDSVLVCDDHVSNYLPNNYAVVIKPL